MRRTMMGFFLIAGFVCGAIAQDNKIPEGVRYKAAPEEINQKAKTMLENLLAFKTPDAEIDGLFSDVVVCAPSLWEMIEEEAKASGLEGNILAGTDFETREGQKPRLVMKSGRFFKTKDQQRLFCNIFSQKLIKNTTCLVRKANTSEIKYYWATIPFDIEEPLLVVEAGKNRFIVNFRVKNTEPKIFWAALVADI